jgi:hypothetical protein
MKLIYSLKMRNIKYISKNYFIIQNLKRIMKDFKYCSSLSFAFIEMCNLKQNFEKINNLILLIFWNEKDFLKYIFCSIDSSLLNSEHSITV